MTERHISVEHAVVYREKNHFAAWPANYGLWCWEEEVLVVFADGRLGDQGKLHARDMSHNFRPRQARSKDGGRSWTVEEFQGHVPGGESLSADEHVERPLRSGPKLQDTKFGRVNAPIDFLDPECILLAARTGLGMDARSWFYLSRNRGTRWEGPFAFIGLDMAGVTTRTDIVPISSRHALFMVTCAKPDGQEGRTLCVESLDGGRSFQAKCWLPYDDNSYSIMPSSVRLGGDTVLTVIRRGRGIEKDGWLESFKSEDLGKSWRPMGFPVENTGPGGNPGSLIRLSGGRLALVYGSRVKPYGIRIKISSDGGRSWSSEQNVGQTAPLPDLGYPRAVISNDGTLLTVYYTNAGRERFIEATRIKVTR